MTSSNIETLTQINLNDLISSFGWQNHPFLARLLRRTFSSPPQAFAGTESRLPLFWLYPITPVWVIHFRSLSR